MRPRAVAEPDYVPGAKPGRTAAVARPGGEAQVFLAGETLPAGWWHWFGSPELNRLVEQAFAASPTLEAARARLRSAEATLRTRQALRSPEIGGQGSLSYGTQQGGGGQQQQGTNPNNPSQPVDPGNPTQPGGQPGTGQPGQPGQPGQGGQTGQGQGGQGGFGGGGSDAFLVYTAGLTVRYDLDVAGRNRRLIEAAEATLENQRQALQAAYLALAGNIASTAFEAAALRAQIVTRLELIAAQDQRIALIRLQVEEGRTARAGLVTTVAEVAALRATVPPLQAQLASAENALAELVGTPPVSAGIPPIELGRLRLPQSVPISVPAALARSRPDILAAEALLRVASAEVGVATADLYPNLLLNGQLGVAGIDGAINAAFSLGGNLFAPLLDGGRRRAQRDVAVAAYQEALGNYRARVLAALVQVANGIRALEYDAIALAEQSTALEAARESYDLALFQEREGGIGPIDVLVVQQRFQDARFAFVQALAQRFQDTAALFAALGPGPLDEAGLRSVVAPEQLRATRLALDSGDAPDPLAPR